MRKSVFRKIMEKQQQHNNTEKRPKQKTTLNKGTEFQQEHEDCAERNFYIRRQL